MKTFGSAEIRFSKVWLHCGYSVKRLAFGIGIDRYSFNIDFAFFWFSIEF
jgi:hypothetical protein